MTAWIERLRWALCTSFGFGCSPFAPGTTGTLPAVAIYVAIALLAAEHLHVWLIAGGLAVSCVLSIALAPWAEQHWHKKDPGPFVLDEVAGYLLIVLIFRTPDLWLTLGWTFVMARAMDILKLPPARQCERLPAGWGILLDDLVASLYGGILLHVIAAFRPEWFGLVP